MILKKRSIYIAGGGSATVTPENRNVPPALYYALGASGVASPPQ